MWRRVSFMRIPSQILIGLIWLYQKAVSPWLGSNCRYEPTCSCYFQGAVEQHGFVRGLALGTKRICSCHPYSQRERFDPVPKGFAWRDLLRYNRNSNSQ